jgi:TetR/AcrR family transcriptional repressor of mexJK operon
VRVIPGSRKEYYARAPGQVIEALASEFAHLGQIGLLRVPNARYAAEQFAYLVAGAPLDRAVLVESIPPRTRVIASAREGVQTFLARYGVARRNRGRTE